MPSALLHVSRSLLKASLDREQLIDIQTVALARNSLLDLTGVLIATPDYFAQYLDGEPAALDAVMTSIIADRRHTDIFVTPTASIEAPRFPTWRMGCFAPGSFTSRFVEPMLAHHHGRIGSTDIAPLIAFMAALTDGFPDTTPSF